MRYSLASSEAREQFFFPPVEGFVVDLPGHELPFQLGHLLANRGLVVVAPLGFGEQRLQDPPPAGNGQRNGKGQQLEQAHRDAIPPSRASAPAAQVSLLANCKARARKARRDERADELQ